jgi:ParB family chromosome partitioning protein
MPTIQKIALSASRDIPFNKLILSQANVRRIKAGVSIEELAEDIARRTLLQSLTVRAVRDTDGNETGMFEIPAGGRRYRALELLIKQKRLARTAPVPCIIREGGIAEEDSLAENIQRAPLHPLDQFRAFQALREKGQSEEDIAAAFFVSVGIVKQRLRLAAVSPRLLEIYAEDEMTLEQLMAFTVNGDHARQEQVYDRLQPYLRDPHAIRRMLTEGSVRAADKRAQFIGLDAYVAAGGTILNDLFQGDDGGWLQDVALVDRLVAEKLTTEADTIRAEGWKWIETAPDFPYGHTYGMRQLSGESAALTDDELATRDALQAEFEQIEAAHEEAEELPEEADRRLAEIETALAAIDDRPMRYDPDEIARAGAFVSIDAEGRLRVERGYVRREDEPPVEPEPPAEPAAEPDSAGTMAAGIGDRGRDRLSRPRPAGAGGE